MNDIQKLLKSSKTERSKLTQAMEWQLHLADRKLDDFREKMAKEILEKEILIKQNENIRQETEAHIQTVIGEQQTQHTIQLEKLKEIENERNFLNEKLQITMEEKSNEEMKRTQLEEKHITAQRMLLEAEEKIGTLEKLSEQLEKALEEEKQAKEEEEAVRNATWALLEEEQRSKENLEALLQQQNSMINEEIQKRNEFAQELENEKSRIQSIADEKEKLAKQLEDTLMKMQATGNRVRKLDTKVAQIAESVFGKVETRLPVSHRGKGFLAEILVSPQLIKPSPEVSEANKKNGDNA